MIVGEKKKKGRKGELIAKSDSTAKQHKNLASCRWTISNNPKWTWKATQDNQDQLKSRKNKQKQDNNTFVQAPQESANPLWHWQ